MMSEVNRRERRRSFFLLGPREKVGPLAQPARALLPSPPGPHPCPRNFPRVTANRV